MDKLISRQAAIDVIKKRLFETAFNNVGIKQNVDETLVDVAENRLENWFDEISSAQSDTTTHDSIPAETGKNNGVETSGDCISRQQAIDALLGITAMRNTIPLDSAIFNIKKLPSAQPERKPGRWIESNPQDSKVCRLMTCSECGKAYIVNINVPYEDWTEAHKFCVECGTDMRGETE